MKKRKEFLIEFPVRYYTEEEVENEAGKDDKGKSVFSKEIVNIPHELITGIKTPTRKQIDDASLEYSAFFGKCMKKGCLTKAMLAKQYADQGGAMNEGDAKLLESLYKEVDRLNNKMIVFNDKLVSQPKIENDSYNELHHLSYKITQVRRQIIDIEGSYLSLFQTTAEMQAQSRLVLWYMLYLTYIKKGGEWIPYFAGDTFEEKCDSYYAFEENDDEYGAYEKINSRSAMIIGFWMFSAAQHEDGGMEFLEKELESMASQEDSEIDNIQENAPDTAETKESGPA